MQGPSYDSPPEDRPRFTARCRFNSNVCSNCVALSQYVDDAGMLSTSFTAPAGSSLRKLLALWLSLEGPARVSPC